jgi:hypothetical protein
MSLLTSDDLSQQALIEHDLLGYLVAGLRAAVQWRVAGEDFSRKLSTLRFISRSFRRHLERVMDLEEFDGYLDEVAARSPQLGRQVDRLRGEHGWFREASRRSVHRLEQASPADAVEFARICDDLVELLDRVEAHSRKEMQLLLEAFDRDIGGEG